MRIATCTLPWSKEMLRIVTGLALRWSRYFMFVVRGTTTERDSGFIDRLRPWLVEAKEVGQWPGTVIGGERRVRAFKYALTRETLEFLLGEGLELFVGDVESGLEDLSFLREDGRPWFGSITHELDAYFELLPGEREELIRALGSSALMQVATCTLPWSKEMLLAVTDLARQRCRYFMLLADADAATERDRQFMQHLSPWLVGSRDSAQWAGSVLGKREGFRVLKYALNDESLHVLREEGLELLSGQVESAVWDLRYLREDATPWFLSITDDRHAEFRLLPGDADVILEHLGPGALEFEGEEEFPGEAY